MADINLLPKKRRFQKRWSSGLIFFFFVILILIFWHLLLQAKINDATKKLFYLGQELSDIKKPVRQNKTDQAVDQEESLKKMRNRFVLLLQGILKNVSEEICLDKLVVKKQEVKVIGQVRSISGLTGFVKKLNGFGCKSAPTIQKIDRKEDSYDFVLLWKCKQ